MNPRQGRMQRRRAKAAAALVAALAACTVGAQEAPHLDSERASLGEPLVGCRHGDATFRASDGATYVDTYRDDKHDGHGRFTWPDGRSYEGEWRAGMRHGEGVETLPGGLSRRCRWYWGDVVRSTCA